MEIYNEAINILKATPAAKNWRLLAAAFERAAARPPVAWDFPVKACQAVGGETLAILIPVAAITCVHMAIILVDDVLDEDPRGIYNNIGAGRATNMAVALNGLGISLLLEAKGVDQHAATTSLNKMISSTAYGQDLDVQNLHTEEGYWAVTRAKSSPYFAAALELGALFGGANEALTAQLSRFGDVFGELMQIHDDLNDSLEVPANVDWLSGRSPLPILFAELVAHPERERFIALRSQVGDGEALQEAQAILVRSGAISYSVNELMLRHKRAGELLQQMKLVDRKPLQELLDQAIAPVKHLFASVGAEFQA